MLGIWLEVGGVQRLIPSTFSIRCPAAFTIGWSLPGINPPLPAILPSKEESNKGGMEGGRGRKRAGEGLYFPFTVPQTLLTVSKRFDSITVVAGVVSWFCSRFVEDPYGVPTTTACPVLRWETTFSSPERVPYHKLKSLLEVPRETILNFPDSEILRPQVWGCRQTPTSCTFPRTLPSLVEHYPKLSLCPKPPQALALFSLSTQPRTSSLLSMILQTAFWGLEAHQTVPLRASMLLPLHCLPLPPVLLPVSLDTAQDQAHPLSRSPYSKTK